MEPDGRTYILPHPAFARAIMTCAGLFALIIAPYELWRGVWPLNVTSPFFSFIMLGGMSVGAAFIWAGIFAPSAQLRFSPGLIEVERRHLWGTTGQIIRSEDIESLTVEERDNSDGPNDWYAVIKVKNGKTIGSRPLGAKAAADAQIAEFKRFVG